MEINNQPYVRTNFKGIDETVMKNFGKLSTKCRQSVATYFNSLEKSDVVDLFLTKENELALKTKKSLNILERGETLPEGAIIEFKYQPRIGVHNNQRMVCVDTEVDGTNKFLYLDFGSPELAQKAYKKVELIAGDEYTDKLPAFGVLIDVAHKLEEPLKKVKEIAANLNP